MMEKAKLITKGKGWIIERLSNGKQLTCSWKNIPVEWADKEVEISFVSGQPIEIKLGDKTIKKENFSHRQNDMRKGNNKYQHPSKRTMDRDQNHYSNYDQIAKAPYNFIPLNTDLIQAQASSKQGHSAYEENRLSGYIDLNIKALTPLFIRGNDNRFLLLNGKPVIPGSSLRGLTKNLVKIMSYGKMVEGEDFEDKTLYKRGTLVEMKGDLAPLPGFLYKDERLYKIRKADLINSKNEGEPHSYFFSNKGCVFTTGKFGNRSPRSFEFVLLNDGSDDIEVSKHVLDSYEDDIQRNNVPDVFQCAKKMRIRNKNIPESIGMPVFYTLDENGGVFSVSHAKYGRIPYPSSIGDHIPEKLRNKGITDFSDAIFGTINWATRVYFEDAVINEDNAEMEEKQPKILSSPKSTSYQLYLEQGKEQGNGNKKWDNANAEIRGYKMYWHRRTSSDSNDDYLWVEKEGNKSDSHPDPIKAVKPGSIFSGRIRFDNLTNEELGSLLAVLQLPEGCCHKLGMAKPLGLGSVKITPTLNLINRKKRYQSIFSGNNWNKASIQENDVKRYQNAFATYILNQIEKKQNNNLEGLWQENRLQELRKMLTWNEGQVGSGNWLKKTSYMELGEFKKKNVLPKPGGV